MALTVPEKPSTGNNSWAKSHDHFISRPLLPNTLAWLSPPRLLGIEKALTPLVTPMWRVDKSISPLSGI